MSSYDAAVDVVGDIEAIVQARLADSQEFSAAAQERANEAIDALTDFNFAVPEAAPEPEVPDITIDGDFNITKPTASSFGSITGPGDMSEPSAPSISTITTPDFPDFDPSVTSINIPEPPYSIDTSGAPTRPDVDTDITIPTAPDAGQPELDPLINITVPDFTFPTLPEFTETAPEFEGSSVVPVLQWAEPTYATTILSDVLAQVQTFLAGGTGIPAAVEAALFARASDREDMLVEQAVKEAYDEFATKGYTMPPGVLVARTDQVRQKAYLSKQSASREITIKAAEWEIENLKFAVQQGVACENVLVNIFLNQAERQFQAAKFEIEAQLQYYNAQVALFNARQTAYSTAAQVFKIEVDAELAQLEMYKTQIQGELAKSQLNESKVKVYQARIDALKASIENYRARMEGARVQAEVAKTLIDGYRVDVEAYAARLGADKIRFEAYSEQVKAEAAKAGIIDAEARAFAAVIQGKATQVDSEVKRAGLDIEVYKAGIQAYLARIEEDKLRMQHQLSANQSAVGAYEADTKRYIAQVEGEKARNELEIRANEVTERIQLAFADTKIKQFDVTTQKMIEAAKINVQGLTAAGQIAATLSAGAMAALHVGAQLTGQGGIAANSQDTNQVITSTSTQTITNIEG
jgi:hypothetical protein